MGVWLMWFVEFLYQNASFFVHPGCMYSKMTYDLNICIFIGQITTRMAAHWKEQIFTNMIIIMIFDNVNEFMIGLPNLSHCQR